MYTLLIVDDDAVTRETLAGLLSHPDYQLEFATNGEAGLRQAAQIHPDAILLDVMMPHMDGFEVCRRLRANLDLAEVPIIMLTALDDRDSRLEGFQAGADEFLTKPFDSAELQLRLKLIARLNRYQTLRRERERVDQALTRLEEQNVKLAQLSRQVLNAHEQERRRLAVELHDGLGQSLTVLKLHLEHATQTTTVEALQALCAEALTMTQTLAQQVREISLHLRPAVLDDLGLFGALDWLSKQFARQSRLRVLHNLNPLEERRFSKTIETTLFRVAQEALTNIVRHAATDEAMMTVVIEPTSIKLTIADMGQGFEPLAVEGHSTGLAGMRERVQLAGGYFQLSSAVGEGTMITVEFMHGMSTTPAEIGAYGDHHSSFSG